MQREVYLSSYTGSILGIDVLMQVRDLTTVITLGISRWPPAGCLLYSRLMGRCRRRHRRQQPHQWQQAPSRLQDPFQLQYDTSMM